MSDFFCSLTLCAVEPSSCDCLSPSVPRPCAGGRKKNKNTRSQGGGHLFWTHPRDKMADFAKRPEVTVSTMVSKILQKRNPNCKQVISVWASLYLLVSRIPKYNTWKYMRVLSEATVRLSPLLSLVTCHLSRLRERFKTRREKELGRFPPVQRLNSKSKRRLGLGLLRQNMRPR